MKNKIVIAFGRMNPPTFSGHGVLVKKVVELAKQGNADHMIVLQATQDKKKNPLSTDRKVYWAKKLFPGVNILGATKQIRTLIDVAKSLTGKYKELVVVAGSDRVEEFKTLLEKYNGKDFNFETITVVQAGERDPDADGAAGMQATKMRKAAVDGDTVAFKTGVGPNLTASEINLLMREIRVGLGLDESRSMTWKKFMQTL